MLAVRDSTSETQLLALVMHPDELTVRVVVAAAENLGVTVAEALFAFGEHFITFMEETGYLDTVRSFGSDVLEFVHNINQMHAHLRRMEIYAAGGGAASTCFSYSSSRGDMLAPVVEGLIPALSAKVYGQRVTLTRLAPIEGYNATWRLVLGKSTDDPEPDAKSKSENGSGRTIRTDAERRAASKWHEAMVGGAVSARVHPLSRPTLSAAHRRPPAPLTPAAAALRASDASELAGRSDAPPAGDCGACAAFVDAEHEATFRAVVLLPRLLRRALALTSAVALVSAALLAVVASRASAHATAALVGLVASSATAGALGLACRRPERCSATAVEAAVCAWLAAVSVALALLLARGDDGGDGGGRGRGDGEGGEQLALLCAGGLVVLSSLLVPLEPHALALNALAALAAFAARLVGARAAPGGAGVATALIVAATLAGAVLNAIERAQTTRFFFGRDKALSHVSAELRRKHKIADYLKAHRTEIAIAARSKLIRVVVHDLRSPLLAASNIGRALSESPEAKLSEPKIVELVGGLRTCVSTMEHIMGDMLDFERIDSGLLALVQAPFVLDRLLRDARTLFASQAAAKGIAFEIEPLPVELSGLEVVGDMPRLLQCLSNGCSNALKFTDEGGAVRIEARSTQHTREGWLRVHLTVSDNGVGLSRPELEQLRMGGLFVQVGRGQLQGRGGTGLGLNIARSILQLHSGSELLLHSEGEGRGTVFELQLNLAKLGYQDVALGKRSALASPAHARSSTNSMVSRARTATSVRTAASPAPAPLRESAAAANIGRALEASIVDSRPTPVAIGVLHVEDDRMLQLTIGAQIRNAGVEVANNGKEALAKVAQRAADGLPPFSLVLMDNQMPLMGGSECTSTLRRRGFDGLIVGCTGDPFGSEDRTLFEAAGLDECVDKTPAGLESILRILKLQKDKQLAAAASAVVGVCSAASDDLTS